MKLASIRELDIGLLVFACMVILALLAGTVSNRRSYHQMRFFIHALASLLLAMVSQVAFLLVNGQGALSGLTKLCTILTIIFGSAVCVLFLYCLCSFVKERQKPLRRLLRGIGLGYGLMCLVILLTLSTDLFLDVDEQGFCHDGQLYFLVKGMFFAANLMALALVFHFRKFLPIRSRGHLLAFGLFLTLASAVIPCWFPTPEYAVATVSCVLLYSFFQEDLLWQLTESKISITLSQMQPHFMYNVLNSIYYLCQRDPLQAQDAIDKFSDYLRNNMGTLEETSLIPFEQEYRHIQTYLSLEQIRFRNLEVVYDIGTTGFLLPPLTAQPLVENAVKHGVTKKRGGGTITISTRETPTQFRILVQDTGVGFDPETYAQDGKLHIGISNVRLRLQHMIGGTLTITSRPGAGTTAILSIPKKEGTRI